MTEKNIVLSFEERLSKVKMPRENAIPYWQL